MASGTISRPPSERRREERHTVHLLGRLQVGDRAFPLEVGDLSISGALILMKGAPQPGTSAELWIEDYGPIAILVMHSGAYFCGVSFTEPSAHRTKLQHWLSEYDRHKPEDESGAEPLAVDAA